MSNQSLFSRRRPVLPPVLPRGEVLSTYGTYADAQAAVDTLAKADFPVKQLSIVGNDLKSVERVTGKLTYGRVALAGAASGAWLGIFFGILFFLFSPTGSSLPFVFAALIMGAGFGMLLGIASYAINRRRRDFTSTMQVIATSYQIIVDVELVNRARNLLGGSSTEPAAAARSEVPVDPAAPVEHE
ncbi:general stress protein [Cryobacterium sp. M15]|uniref:general stress protein n=1 Tax=Cryobacterium sp. M15 TaxID=2048291 RepID=UPI001E559472|nr:general stress protein [Cryobacterium sp. M15]